jgi:chaperone required for assembly of F1-ATPase
VDEDWNMELWGCDELGLKRRAYRFAEMAAAAQVLGEMGGAGGQSVSGASPC